MVIDGNRTDKGPRHRLLCYLGELNSSQKKSWRKIISVFNNDGQEEQLALFPSETALEDGEDVVKINLKSVRLELRGEFGAIYTGLEMWERLGLDKFWEEKIDPEPKGYSGRMPDVPWSKVAAILAINRLCAPRK